jgi:hypothetical protein
VRAVLTSTMVARLTGLCTVFSDTSNMRDQYGPWVECGMKLRRVCVCVCVWGKGLECESEMRNGTEESRGRKETRGDGQG